MRSKFPKFDFVIFKANAGAFLLVVASIITLSYQNCAPNSSPLDVNTSSVGGGNVTYATVNVSVTPQDSGQVTDATGVIVCGNGSSRCVGSFAIGKPVILYASSAGGTASSLRWSGDFCVGSTSNQCVFNLDANTQLQVSFQTQQSTTTNSSSSSTTSSSFPTTTLTSQTSTTHASSTTSPSTTSSTTPSTTAHSTTSPTTTSTLVTTTTVASTTTSTTLCPPEDLTGASGVYKIVPGSGSVINIPMSVSYGAGFTGNLPALGIIINGNYLQFGDNSSVPFNCDITPGNLGYLEPGSQNPGNYCELSFANYNVSTVTGTATFKIKPLSTAEHASYTVTFLCNSGCTWTPANPLTIQTICGPSSP